MFKFEFPEWTPTNKVHDWRNHVPGQVQEIWNTFSFDQKKALYEWAEALAFAEEWD